MKFAIFALVCCVSTFVAAQEQELIDWHQIEPLDIHVEPIGPAPVASPGLRIIGGNTATRNGFPYIVALIVNNSGFCGGSIISRTFVLTAAHCVDSNSPSIQVIAGAHNPRTTINEPTQVRLSAVARTLHSGWNRNTMQNDIAVIRLASIPLGSGISIVTLAFANSPTYADSTATLAGWGRTSDASTAVATELQTVNLPVISNAICAQSYGTIINTQHICTSGIGYRGVQGGACNGDSGGPLTVDGHQVGVVSFGAASCQAGYPSVYARVSSFRSWITANTGA